MLNFINLYGHAINKKIDHGQVLSKAKKIIIKKSSRLSIIVPVYGRVSFLDPMIHYFRVAEANSSIDISYTIVEHSESPLHMETCQRLEINYLWIEKKNAEAFNKCLAMNIGACAVKGEEYLFHDIDCLVTSEFFNNLYKNIDGKDAKAIQTFSDRRVLYLNDTLTNKALDKELIVDHLKEGPTEISDINYTGVTPPRFTGAPGGSIWIKAEEFINVGGYDPNIFFGYSPEDAFFWNKVSTMGTMHTCTNPRNEIFHMKHPITELSNPHLNYLIELRNIYASRCSQEEKIKFINLQKSYLLDGYK